jgi:hypothetical protein
MGRRSDPKRPTLTPIPADLAALIDDQGRYFRRGFVPGEHDASWDAYKRLKAEYCQRAGIRRVDFRRSVIRASTP